MTSGVTRIEVEADRILVRPSLADAITCSRLGGKWMPGLGAWLFPSGERHAQLLRAKLRGVAAQDVDGPHTPMGSVDAPARAVAEQAPVLAAASEVAEPEVEIPEGLLTRPWRHQQAAFQFCIDKFGAGLHGILLVLGMGVGKSLVALMVMLFLRAQRVIVACPLRVVPVWVGQIAKHLDIPLVVVALDDEVCSVARKSSAAAHPLGSALAGLVPRGPRSTASRPSAGRHRRGRRPRCRRAM